ncbi:MAG: hypothetical protein KAS69_04525 [Planctomycetes bacterium]|nr:hypothetical protein [Planctomycetota bacterium]
MKKFAKKTIVLGISVALFLVIAGCQEQNISNPKQSRLVAAQNIQLKKDLVKKDKTILKSQQQLEKCLNEKEALQSKPDSDDSLTKFLFEETVRLQHENEELKLQIDELKKNLEGLKEVNTKQQSSLNYTDWISECIKRSQTIQSGMTRGELLKVFTIEGGLSGRTSRRYVYKGCPYIKVDVYFRAVGDGRDEMSDDVITEISKPFLEWSITD